MRIVVLKMLFTLSMSAQFGKHIYVTKNCEWLIAQKYCRATYTDLSPITTRWEEERLKNATIGKVTGKFWIGLYKEIGPYNNGTQWKWSGGGDATNIKWDDNEPDPNQNYGCVCWDCEWSGWHNYQYIQLPFFCLNLIVVKMKMTWERALEHCRENHTDLTSLLSETEQLLAQNEIQKEPITERVWIGLRYLEGRWLWVNGDPLVYQAWPQGDQNHQCPIWTHCGALTRGGGWENRDCQEELYFICS